MLEVIAFCVLLAALITAFGVIWRAIKGVAREIKALAARIQKLQDLTEPEDE